MHRKALELATMLRGHVANWPVTTSTEYLDDVLDRIEKERDFDPRDVPVELTSVELDKMVEMRQQRLMMRAALELERLDKLLSEIATPLLEEFRPDFDEVD